MAPHDPFDDMEEEDNYHESSDEDFNPTTAPADESSTSSEEDENGNEAEQSVARKSKVNSKANGRRKRKTPATDNLDSGDEATIQAANKRKAKKRKGNNGGADGDIDDDNDNDDGLMSLDDEGGEAGLIRTRAQRRVEPKEKRPLARTDGATVDVDALWAAMSAAPLYPIALVGGNDVEAGNIATDPHAMRADGKDIHREEEATGNEPDLVWMCKTYTFAGQRTTEEKHVPHAAIEKHLADGWKRTAVGAGTPSVQETVKGDHGNKNQHQQHHEDDEIHGQGQSQCKIRRRPLRRPSRFDPNPTGYVRSLPPEHQLTWPRKFTAPLKGHGNVLGPDAPKTNVRSEKAQKLNVVDKSRLDWTGFVNKEGIAEELQIHGKTKEAYLGRMDFLAGVEARQEEERRRAKTTVVV